MAPVPFFVSIILHAAASPYAAMEDLRYLVAYVVTGFHVAAPAAYGVFEATEEMDFELTGAGAARTGVIGEIVESDNDCRVLTLSVQRGRVLFNGFLA